MEYIKRNYPAEFRADSESVEGWSEIDEPTEETET